MKSLPEKTKPVWLRFQVPGPVHHAARLKAFEARSKFKDWLKQAVTDCAKAE